MLLATDSQKSILAEVAGNATNYLTYSGYGHQSARQQVATRLGFNGELREAQTCWYLLGNGYRAYNPQQFSNALNFMKAGEYQRIMYKPTPPKSTGLGEIMSTLGTSHPMRRDSPRITSVTESARHHPGYASGAAADVVALPRQSRSSSRSRSRSEPSTSTNTNTNGGSGNDGNSLSYKLMYAADQLPRYPDPPPSYAEVMQNNILEKSRQR
ncbi:hypothetical protein [Pseudomonas fluorescens]|uniref:hypothetical protein n=1 Tax=Pseudomonas fluorescens TaxID=294 RepID=UPI0012416C67|nr:hypothetical protein [Pseudomonas fluorescens]